MTNNINNNDLYIILSSFACEKNPYSLEDLKNYALATNSADAFINLLELDTDGIYYFGNLTVKDAVDKIVAENPDSARGLLLNATVEAIKYGRERWGSADVSCARGFIRTKNYYASDIKTLTDEIAQIPEGQGKMGVYERLAKINNIISEQKRCEENLRGTDCETLYKKAMLAYVEEAKEQNPADANVSKAEAYLLKRAYGFDDEVGYSYDDLTQASCANPENSELKYYQVCCGQRDKKLSFSQSTIEFEEIADQDLSEEGEKAIEMGVDYFSNADEMAE